METTTLEPRPSPALLFETINSFQRTAALKTAIELGFFTAIAEGKDTPAALAARCNTAVRGARILADYLTVLGFLTKHTDHYALTSDTALFLSELSPAYAGRAIEFLCSPASLSNFSDLTTRVKKGGAPLENHVVSYAGQDFWVPFARGMAGLMTLPAQLLAKQILADDTPLMKILDVGAGHGLFGISFARQNPNAYIVAQDWPAVLEVARENAARFRVLPRYETLRGNALAVEFGKNFDLVLLPNILHHFDPIDCERLLRKVHEALKPGGRAVTLEFIPNDDRISPPASAMFSLVMLAHTAGGDAYTLKEYDRMFRNAGFTRSTCRDLAPGMQQVLISQK